jgi:hypothetical protein
MGLIDKFHQDPDVIVFLISTLAGGTGSVMFIILARFQVMITLTD